MTRAKMVPFATVTITWIRRAPGHSPAEASRTKPLPIKDVRQAYLRFFAVAACAPASVEKR